ncbi:hypothetical protein GOODEAATRI_008719, partial [Goodea atripinnis]
MVNFAQAQVASTSCVTPGPALSMPWTSGPNSVLSTTANPLEADLMNIKRSIESPGQTCMLCVPLLAVGCDRILGSKASMDACGV